MISDGQSVAFARALANVFIAFSVINNVVICIVALIGPLLGRSLAVNFLSRVAAAHH